MRRQIVLALLVAIGMIAASVKPTTAEETGFSPMFTDAAMTGWVRTNTPPDTWTFRDGVLYCTGKPIGEIRTAKMYQNFILELEWRHMKPKGNAGIFLWADDITSRGVPFHRGIEVQVLENAYGNNRSHTTHGDIFPIHGATMNPINGHGGMRAFPTEQRAHPSPEWNHYRIEARDGNVSLAVNGKVVTRGTDCVPRKGYLCLESEGGIVEYRNVRIQELPTTEIANEQIAIADRGYESLYSGLDLRGWKIVGDVGWKAQDWVLSHRRNETSRLSSERMFHHSSFVVDVRLDAEGSNAKISSGKGFDVDLSDPALAPHLEKRGRWNRIESRVLDGKRTLWINDVEAVSHTDDSDSPPSPLVLSATGNVSFANLYATPRADSF